MALKNKKYYKHLLVGVVLVAIIAVTGILELTNTTHIFHDTPKPMATTGGANTKGTAGTITQKQANSQTGNNTSESDTNNTKQPDANSGNSSSNLLAPWGTFFNNSPVKESEQMGSTCNTSAGASCQIIFTTGSITKSLEVETTDAGGAAYWSWKPKSIGLTPGTWHVSAKAILGSQIKTTSNDPLTLEVTQ